MAALSEYNNINGKVNYEDEVGHVQSFLTSFKGAKVQDDDGILEGGIADLDISDVPLLGEDRGLKYKQILQQAANRQIAKIEIDLEDLRQYDIDTGNEALINHVMGNSRRYVELFGKVIDSNLPPPDREIVEDVLDVIVAQRRERNAQNEEVGELVFPAQLLRRYNVYFKPPRPIVPLAVRQVKGAHLGKFITVAGIVTRVSEVKPLLLVNAYSCDSCGMEIFQEVDDKSVTPLQDCISQTCVSNTIKGSLHMQTRASKFESFQEVKIQELADQVPVGHIPRSMSVHLVGAITRSVSPGDVVHISGIFVPVPYSGFRALRAGLLTDTYLEAHHVRQLKKQYTNLDVTPQIEREIIELKQDPAAYQRLACSIAPEIFGHEDVKKALLLLMVGGVTKDVSDGMMIRGDINICLMGDPGVAKSQLLKYISKVAPRGVYTTGRGSSGVGLTAAVMRDPVTDEMVLEGGALVLADNGIACIDEFDKMEEADRTAIHEVMEQQTISISKAGITTTLNARTSILAAANPLYGRYNTKVSPVENINLPAALLSRFDLLFLILDRPSRDDDEELAHHVTYVHMHNEHPPLQHEPLSPILMRHYIALARKKRPVVSKAVSDYIVGAYVQLRKQQQDEEAREQSFTYTSARTLLAVLRLSQAAARLRFADVVEIPDVNEALRLMEVSKASLFRGDNVGEETDRTTTSKVYQIIRNLFATARGRDDDDMEVDMTREHVEMRQIREQVLMQGYTEHQLMDCIQEYENLDVWQLEGNNTLLTLL